MKPEKKLWGVIKKWFPHDSSLNRIESHTTSIGFPDVEYFYKDCRGVIELKTVGKLTDSFFVRPAQICWLKRRIKAGDIPIFVVGVMDGFSVYVISAKRVLKATTMPYYQIKENHPDILCKITVGDKSTQHDGEGSFFRCLIRYQPTIRRLGNGCKTI